MIESLLAIGLRSVGDHGLRAGDIYADKRCLVCRGIACQLLLPQFQVACIARVIGSFISEIYSRLLHHERSGQISGASEVVPSSTIDKEEDRKLWGISPLPDKLIEYAGIDVYAMYKSWKIINNIVTGWDISKEREADPYYHCNFTG